MIPWPVADISGKAIIRISIIALLIMPYTISARAIQAPADDAPQILRAPLARDREGPEFYSFADKVAATIQEILYRLDLEGILVAIPVDTERIESHPFEMQHSIYDADELQLFDEAIVVRSAVLLQSAAARPRDERHALHESFFTPYDQGRRAPPAGNIRTTITLQAEYYDIEREQYLGALQIQAEYCGGDSSRSRERAWKKLEQKLVLEFTRIYSASAGGVLDAAGSRMTLDIGSQQGVDRNMYMEIIAPDRITGEAETEGIVDGGVVALGAVLDVAEECCTLRIVRQWRDHYPGSWALYRPGSLFALQLTVTPALMVNYSNYTLHFHAGVERALEGGGGFSILRAQDSQGRDDYGFGFSGFTLWRFLNRPRLDGGVRCGFDFDIPFRKDDDGGTVSTLLFSLHVGFTGEIVLSPGTDLVLFGGYRHGFKNSHWNYSREEETLPAYWLGEAPEVNNTGFFLSVGYKWIF